LRRWLQARLPFAAMFNGRCESLWHFAIFSFRETTI